MIATQTSVRMAAAITAKIIPFATLRFTPFLSPAPYRWAVRIENPAVIPCAKPVARNMIVPVEPTAASAPAPTQRPTMIVSAIL